MLNGRRNIRDGHDSAQGEQHQESLEHLRVLGAQRRMECAAARERWVRRISDDGRIYMKL